MYDVLQQQYDEKNIRRRVYDALNVLMAMDIISKDKKEIQWRGLPRTSMNDIEELKVSVLQQHTQPQYHVFLSFDIKNSFYTWNIIPAGFYNLIFQKKLVKYKSFLINGRYMFKCIAKQQGPSRL